MMEPLFWIFRLLFFPLTPIATLIRVRLKGWDVLVAEEERLDADFWEIDRLLTPSGTSRSAWLLWHSSPDGLRHEIARCLSDYLKLHREANDLRHRSKFYFQTNLDARHRRIRAARFDLVLALEQFERDWQLSANNDCRYSAGDGGLRRLTGRELLRP